MTDWDRVEKLHLEDGDILVLKDFESSQIRGLMESAHKAGFKKKCPVLIMHGDQTVETMTAEEMEQKGWVRAKP
jgi:hypothetical protein